jgi:hypothetical protein
MQAETKLNLLGNLQNINKRFLLPWKANLLGIGNVYDVLRLGGQQWNSCPKADSSWRLEAVIL